MQRKGERQTMTGKEYCRYIRTYSELEGLQRAHTVVYCAQTVPGGVLAQLRWEQAGRVQCSAVLAPQVSRQLPIRCINLSTSGSYTVKMGFLFICIIPVIITSVHISPIQPLRIVGTQNNAMFLTLFLQALQHIKMSTG